jgi:hypothetical protein
MLLTRDCSMHEHAAAGAFVASYYSTDGRHLTRPFRPAARAVVGGGGRVSVTDAAPKRRTRDQGTAEGEYTGSFRSRGERSEMGADPESEVGPTIAARLPGPASAYSILDEDGEAVVIFHGRVSGGLDPGNVVSADRRLILDRVARERSAGARMAQQIATFWRKQSGHHG